MRMRAWMGKRQIGWILPDADSFYLALKTDDATIRLTPHTAN